MGNWMEGPLVGFDTETTGTDVWNDRIITAALVYKPSFTAEPLKYEWMINTGEEIPEGATKIHGITNERMQEEGKNPQLVLNEICYLLHQFTTQQGAAVVAFNAAYDLTILREDTVRAGGTFAETLYQAPVIDPLVIDKQTDKYRKGKRTLSATAEMLGIDTAGAHGALADVIMTMRVAYKLAARYPKLQVEASQIHEWQKDWKNQQELSFAEYKRKTDPNWEAQTDCWPIHPLRVEEENTGGVTW